MRDAYYLLELSGDYPYLGEYEIESMMGAYDSNFSVLEKFRGKFLLISTSDFAGWTAIRRSAYIKSAWKILEFIDKDSDIREFKHILENPRYKLSFKVIDKEKRADLEQLYRKMVNAIEREKLPGLPKQDLQLIDLSDNYALGIRITTGREIVGKRNPQYRPYAPSATMDSYLSRALVNFSRVLPGQVFLDPFAGSGSIAMEASSVGAYTIAIDKSLKHLLGFKVNAMYFDLDVKIINGDSTYMPIADNSIDAIATDPPYGRSAPVFKTSLKTIYHGFIKESSRVLNTGNYLVFCSSKNFDPTYMLGEYGFDVIRLFEMPVHHALTRLIFITTLI